uniref:NADH dehydrogenase [ubiquinone] 1 alpha subcomplex assembly factor 3 n=1 Tax=Ditylum brightwellii TaxID=49249 RepID=A0A6U3PGG2_9STRA|mmetsp:Transcript_1536/g.2495  ORF Transcript_1536/g.2495 Transcript_1536/m.2495 type:complete len:137 (+) Transcript_1536:1-411(+)
MVDFSSSSTTSSNNNNNNTNRNNKLEENSPVDKSGEVHVNSSIIAFPHSCFLWRPTCAKEVTLESLAIIGLYKPSLEYLFIGCDAALPPRELNKIKRDMKERGVVVDQMDVMNAMGTFNVLNGEDRRVAVALVLSA